MESTESRSHSRSNHAPHQHISGMKVAAVAKTPALAKKSLPGTEWEVPIADENNNPNKRFNGNFLSGDGQAKKAAIRYDRPEDYVLGAEARPSANLSHVYTFANVLQQKPQLVGIHKQPLEVTTLQTESDRDEAAVFEPFEKHEVIEPKRMLKLSPADCLQPEQMRPESHVAFGEKGKRLAFGGILPTALANQPTRVPEMPAPVKENSVFSYLTSGGSSLQASSVKFNDARAVYHSELIASLGNTQTKRSRSPNASLLLGMYSTSSGHQQSAVNTKELSERLYSEHQVRNEKLRELADRVRNDTMSECTFAPRIHSLPTHEGLGGQRRVEDFLEDQANYKKMLDCKVQQLREMQTQADGEGLTWKPEISEKSKRIAQKKDQGVPIYERLYQEAHDRELDLLSKPAREDELKPVPSIQEKSRNIVRNRPIDELLYEDAIRRQERQKERVEEEAFAVEASRNQSTMELQAFKKSAKVAAVRFVKHFERVYYHALGGVTSGSGSETVTYAQLWEILCGLGFVKRTSKDRNETPQSRDERFLVYLLWNLLQKSGKGVSKRNILTCIFAIAKHQYEPAFDSDRQENVGDGQAPMAHDDQKDACDDLPEESSLEEVDIKLGKEILEQIKLTYENGVLQLSSSDTKLLNRLFEIFYVSQLSANVIDEERRLAAHQEEELKNASIRERNELSMKSEILARQHREKILRAAREYFKDMPGAAEQLAQVECLNVEELLALEHMMNENHKRRKAEMIRREQMKECTFKPDVNHYDDGVQRCSGAERGLELFELGRKNGWRRDRDRTEIEFEKAKDECTFAPKLMTNKSQYSTFDASRNGKKMRSNLPKDSNKAIERMRIARMEKEAKDKMLGRGYVSGFKCGVNSGTKFKSAWEKNGEQEKKSGRNSPAPSQPQRVERCASRQNANGTLNTLPNQTEEEQQEENDIPMLYVDVNIGTGRTERIIINEGDDTYELAKAFAYKFGLDNSVISRLKDMLDAQVTQILARIEEEQGVTEEDDGSNAKSGKRPSEHHDINESDL